MGCVSVCVLFVVNLVVLGVGVAVVSMASYVIYTTGAYSQLFVEGILMLPMWTLIGGLALTLLGIFGFCGVVAKSPWMLRCYGGLVIVFFLMELVCGILLLVMRDQAPEYLKDKMIKTFERYPKDPSLAASIDNAQHQLKCCGVQNYQEWYFIIDEPDVTPGCCREDSGLDAEVCYKNLNKLAPNEIEERIYTDGCYDSMVEDLSEETLALAILSLILVLVQLMCIIMAIRLASKLAKKKRLQNKTNHSFGVYA